MKAYIICALCVVLIAESMQTPLDDYVNTPDPHYTYKLVKAYSETGYTLYILNMTSQKWQDGMRISSFISNKLVVRVKNHI